ncbi:MAG: UDP-N-acetylmuramoyl-L-alanyl-D-glutamate--2,6-diaminopimelate ligase [Akkermansiaceae bacterium]|nr:UDP-N-acetylmuramoyl-L-alanyl-D-glutamate--2,6-diaminopimelate ligase [Armatimonadota bacterium]
MTRQKTLNQITANLPGAILVPENAGENLVTSVAFDSRKVTEGTLFIAVPGEKFDGHSFVRDVVAKGASAVVVQAGREAEFSDLSVPCIVVPDTRKAMARIAVTFYDNPTAKLHLAGVTGTNGKTTTALMIESIARAAGDKTAYVGTLGFGINGEIVEGDRTTPEAIDLQAFFARCVDEGVTAVAIEVASHALALGRTDGCLFDVAVFTNLTQDHLDYHGTMEAYRDAKGILFKEYAEVARANGKNYVAVLNADDDAHVVYSGRARLCGISTNIEYATINQSHIKPVDILLAVDSISYNAHVALLQYRAEIPVRLGFGGTFNVENSLAAVGYGVARGLSPEVIAEGLRTCPPVPGRFQPVQAGQDFAVLVDYAHTPDGLDNVLKSARPLTKGRLISVFGCGGDRDKTKRPKMGRIAKDLSDIAVATSDNPRTENPEAILDDVLAGMGGNAGAEVRRESDRRKAIALAVSLAQAGDTIVIAGKGHETYQIIGTETFPFDDVQVAKEEIEKCSAR